MKDQYRARAKWLFHRSAIERIAKLRSDSGAGGGTGDYMWEPSNKIGEPDMLREADAQKLPVADPLDVAAADREIVDDDVMVTLGLTDGEPDGDRVIDADADVEIVRETVADADCGVGVAAALGEAAGVLLLLGVPEPVASAVPDAVAESEPVAVCVSVAVAVAAPLPDAVVVTVPLPVKPPGVTGHVLLVNTKPPPASPVAVAPV